MRERRTGLSVADAVPGALELGRGLGRTQGTPVGISGTAGTFLRGVVCLNMK